MAYNSMKVDSSAFQNSSFYGVHPTDFSPYGFHSRAHYTPENGKFFILKETTMHWHDHHKPIDTHEAMKHHPGMSNHPGHTHVSGASHYADPEDKAYPLDTPEHIHAAASLFGMHKGKYSPEKRAEIQHHIEAAQERVHRED